MIDSGIKAAVCGASGACGQFLIQNLSKSGEVSKITILTRPNDIISWWKEDPKIEIREIDYDKLGHGGESEINSFRDYDSFFCCLGGRSKQGKAALTKIDFTYPLEFGILGKKAGANHYSIVTAQGAKKKAWMLVYRLKYQIEEALKELKYDYLTILQPGVITDRKADKRATDILAACMKKCPIMANVSCAKIAQVMCQDSIHFHKKEDKEGDVPYQTIKVYKNKEIKKAHFDAI